MRKFAPSGRQLRAVLGHDQSLHAPAYHQQTHMRGVQHLAVAQCGPPRRCPKSKRGVSGFLEKFDVHLGDVIAIMNVRECISVGAVDIVFRLREEKKKSRSSASTMGLRALQAY